MAAKLANLSPDEFRSLNPVVLEAGDSRRDRSHQILLPFDNASAFERNLKTYSGSLSSWTTYTVDQRATPAAIAQKIGVDADTLMEVNKIPVGMRLKPGSTIVVPRGSEDDEDISADVAESAMLAVEPDVPDTRKMLIRCAPQSDDGGHRRALRCVDRPVEGVEPHAPRQGYARPGDRAARAGRQGDAFERNPVRSGSRPSVQGGGVEKIGTRVADAHSESHYDKKNGRGRSAVVKVSEPVGQSQQADSVQRPAPKGKVTKVSASTSSKASKAAAESHPKTAASAKKGN